MNNTAGRTQTRALVVEDEPFVSKFYEAVLKREGLRTDIAVNGEDAQRLLTDNDYHIIICDIKMPVLSGEQLFEWLKTGKPKLVNRVIFATGSIMGEGTRRFLNSTGQPVLQKPFLSHDLLEAIQKLEGIEG